MSTSLTNFSSGYLESDKSDKAILVSNSDFLQAIFGNNSRSECPMLVSFEDNPTNVAKHKWYGYP